MGVPERFFFYAGNLDPRKNVVALTQAASTTFRATGVPLVISGARLGTVTTFCAACAKPRE